MGGAGEALRGGPRCFQVELAPQTTVEQMPADRATGGLCKVTDGWVHRMRILARFPDLSVEHPAMVPSASAEELPRDAPVTETPPPFQTTASPEATDASPAETPVPTSPPKDTPPTRATAPADVVPRSGPKSGFRSLITPRRRGLRQPPMGWGSIAFLAIVAAGVWAAAWWQDREAIRLSEEQPSPRLSTAALDESEQLTR